MRWLVLLVAIGCRGRGDAVDPDVDGDGVPASADCDDANADAFPGGVEVCNGVDDDCDGLLDDDATDAVTVYVDADADGHGNVNVTAVACGDPPDGYSALGDDCDDADATIHPGADEPDCDDPVDYDCDGLTAFDDGDRDGFPGCDDCDDDDPAQHRGAIERCNGEDDDCDTFVDEDAVDAAVFWDDTDDDGFGDPATVVRACARPEGAVANDDDCDPSDRDVHPGADEHCDDVDEDCDDDVDDDAIDAPTWYGDADRDGSPGDVLTVEACDAPTGFAAAPTDCDDLRAAAHPGATELCNGLLDDCSGTLPANEADADGDGWRVCAGDCADTGTNAAARHPGAVETCNQLDDDCDVDVDEGVPTAPVWYADLDGDGFGASRVTTRACASPGAGWTAQATDCDDLHADVFPGAPERCDGVKNDCAGAADPDDVDADGDGWLVCRGDCADDDDSRWPGAPETCDGDDDDCDGVIDDDPATGTAFHRDLDGDGFGDPALTTRRCGPSTGWVEDGTDCDDLDRRTYPGAPERCDGVLNDCDGTLPAIEVDTDADGYLACDGDCAPGDGDVFPGAFEACNGVDDDCDDGTADLCAGDLPELPASGCADVLATHSDPVSGPYWMVDPCGGQAPKRFWCDMDRAGGAWTVAGWQPANAKTSLGITDRGAPGDASWSTSLACLQFSEVMIFNATFGETATRSYTPATWSFTGVPIDHGPNGQAFEQGTYGPAGSLIMMGCVDYGYSGTHQFGCDNDSVAGQKGHLADYAGEYCSGGRLDNTWAWSNGSTCAHRGVMYTWGIAIR